MPRGNRIMGRNTMTPADHFYHLLMMAAADKRMNEAELAFLSERAHDLGISQDEFHDALQRAVKGEGELTIPKGNADRRSLLKDLIMMMAADGVLDDREKKLFAQVAAAMEIETEDLHRVIDATIAERG